MYLLQDVAESLTKVSIALGEAEKVILYIVQV